MNIVTPCPDTRQERVIPAVDILPADDRRHGTQVGYKDNRCRCGTCRTAMARAANIYRMRRAANGGRPLMVDKLGSVRRLQALMALGWPRRDLARRAGYRGDAFALILNSPRRMVTITTDQRVADLYERLSMTHGPSERTRQYAAGQGWPPPLAWDDIDDPSEEPQDWRYAGADRHCQLDDLLERGASVSEAARVLGITAITLEKWCDRHGRRADFNRLTARETPLPYQQKKWTA